MHKTITLPVCFILLAITATAQKYPNLAPAPPMGWNSWNFFDCRVTEANIKRMADAMASNGMKEAGYEYIVIDDCWQKSRDKDGYIVADPLKFPSGIKALADYVHARGLKFGIYSDAGTLTCQHRPGSAGYEDKDAQRYAEWGVDYLKYDWCSTDGMSAPVQYSKMRDALYRAKRPVVFSICTGGDAQPWLWGDTTGQLWRATADIQDRYATGHGVLAIFDEMARLRIHNKPNAWKDADMLQAGNIGLSLTQSRTHFTLWCMMSTPLMLGNNLLLMPPAILKILTNKNAIAVNQDKLGIPCFFWANAGLVEAWIKPLADGSYAVCFLNRSTRAANLNFNWQQPAIDADYKKTYAIDGSFTVFDVWKNQSTGTTAQNIHATIKGEDVLFVLLKKR
jgi:alpha-galactosidase